MSADAIQSLKQIVPDLNPTYYFSEEMASKLKEVTELPEDTIKNVISILTQKKSEITEKVQKIESDHTNYADNVAFDIGTKESFLETEQVEENNNFYELEVPSAQSLFVAKVLVILLGRSNVIVQDDNTTWDNVKKCFKEEMDNKISTLLYKFLS